MNPMEHKPGCPLGSAELCESCKTFMGAAHDAKTEEDAAYIGRNFAQELCTCNDCLCDFLTDDGEWNFSIKEA